MNRDFDEVDVDLLADYIGGALDGTPEHAAIADRIARDETWRAAYEALAEGMATVGTNLGALGAEPEPMPADVAERLDRAFTTSTGPRLVAVGGDERPARGVPGTTRARRTRRWALPVAVAAVVLACVGFGVNYLDRSATTSSNSAAGNAQSAPKAADGQALAALPPADQILSTGTDYRHTTIVAGPRRNAGSAPYSAPNDSSARVAASLDRLRPQAALLACLNAIAVENGAGRIAVQQVDYARYDGAPAIVVRFTAGNGSWVWASGPECGAPGVGANRVDAAKVG